MLLHFFEKRKVKRCREHYRIEKNIMKILDGKTIQYILACQSLIPMIPRGRSMAVSLIAMIIRVTHC